MNFIKNTWKTLFQKQSNQSYPQQKQKQNPSSNPKTEQAPSQEQHEQIPDEIVDQLFTLCSQLVKSSKNISSDQTKLAIYAHYKQATNGDCNTEKPQMFDFVGKSKWSAWDSIKGMSRKQAKMEYVRIVSEADPQIKKNINQKFENEEKAPKKQDKQEKEQRKAKQPLGLQLVQTPDYSQSYSHPYFRPIAHNLPIDSPTHDLLLTKNNEPAVYPLHFAIQKQRLDLVKLFLQLLSVQEIESMTDAEGTGVLQYSELMENQEILAAVKHKLEGSS